MNNLVTINNGQAVVSSRQIAENFGKEHKNILRDIEVLLEGMLKSGQTPQIFHRTTYVHPQNRQEYPEYLMNRDGFTLLAMGFTGTKAIGWKLRYIQAFNEMEKQLSSPFAIPQTFAEALQLAATQALQIEQLQPKGEYYDALVDGDLLTNFRDTAKEIGMPERKFIQWLLDKGYIYRDKSKNKKLKPYAEYNGTLFVIKEFKADDSEYVGNRTMITVAGRKRFLREVTNDIHN